MLEAAAAAAEAADELAPKPREGPPPVPPETICPPAPTENVSASSCAFRALYSAVVAAYVSPRHTHSIGLRQVFPGRLKSHAAQSSSVTIAEGCSRFVRMMLGYIAATSRW